MLKIEMEQNKIFLLKKVKILKQSILMILELLLNSRMIWFIFIKILQNAIQISNPLETESFIRGKKLNIFSCFHYTIIFCCRKSC